MIECVEQFVHPDTSMDLLTFVLTRKAIIVDSMYGCEEAAILLDALGFVFIMSCKADRPSYVFSEVHTQILKHGDYGWLARQGLTNTIFAISLWNAPSKKKKYV